MIVDTELTSYSVRFRCVQSYTTDRAQIYCYSANRDTQLLIAFQSEGETVGKARIDTLNTPTVKTRVVTFFPIIMFYSVYRVLQTEKPITLYANDSNDYTQVVFGTRTDALEPIGEEEHRRLFL